MKRVSAHTATIDARDKGEVSENTSESGQGKHGGKYRNENQ